MWYWLSSVDSVNCLNSVNSLQAVYSAVLPSSLMVFSCSSPPNISDFFNGRFLIRERPKIMISFSGDILLFASGYFRNLLGQCSQTWRKVQPIVSRCSTPQQWLIVGNMIIVIVIVIIVAFAFTWLTIISISAIVCSWCTPQNDSSAESDLWNVWPKLNNICSNLWTFPSA